MQQTSKGAMLAVHCSLDRIKDLIDDKVSLATENSPQNVVISGDIREIDAQELLFAAGLEKGEAALVVSKRPDACSHGV